LLFEEQILPLQIQSYKVKKHKQFIKTWQKKEQRDYSFDELWSIREACIHALNQ